MVLACVVCLVGCGSDDGASEAGDSETGGEPQECAAISIATGDGPGAQQLELLAVREQIPGLREQPTTRGQALGVLAAFDGRLHLGYGDYSDNTGPILMTAWDPGLGEFVDHGVAPTEEVQRLFVRDDALYCPAVDPDGHEESGGVYRLDCGAGQWVVETPIDGAVHVYDVAAQGEVIYACTGSVNDAPALVMASVDRGHTWTEALRRESPAGKFSRFYFMGATAELVFVSGRDHPDPGEAFAFVRHGDGVFEAIVDVPGGSLVPIVLGDELRVAAFSGSTYLTSYRVEGTSLIEAQPWPAVDGVTKLVTWTTQPADVGAGRPEQLLVLLESMDGSYVVQRSADLAAGAGAWQPLASLAAPLAGDAAPDRFVSMALLLGDLYLGTQAGSLHVLRELDAPAP